jgi:hypothetical protein
MTHTGGNMAKKKRALRITLDAETARQYKLYVASVPKARALPKSGRLEAVIRYALRDWMESIGEGHIEDALGVESEATRAINRMSFESDPGEEKEAKETASATCNKSCMN